MLEDKLGLHELLMLQGLEPVALTLQLLLQQLLLLIFGHPLCLLFGGLGEEQRLLRGDLRLLLREPRLLLEQDP